MDVDLHEGSSFVAQQIFNNSMPETYVEFGYKIYLVMFYEQELQ